MKKKEKSAIRGMLLGDANIRKRKKTYTAELTITHSVKQKEYLNFKKDFLEKAFNKKVKTYEFTSKGKYEELRFSITHRYLNYCYKWLCKNHKRYVTLKYLRKVSNQGIAFWYMDDGSLYSKKTKEGKIHAYELMISMYTSKEEAESAIIFMKERFNVDFTLKYNKGAYSIRCGTKMAKKFLSQIEDYIPNFMSYKTFRQKEDT